MNEVRKRVQEYLAHMEESELRFNRFQAKAEQLYKTVQEDEARVAEIISEITETTKELDNFFEEMSTILRQMPAAKTAANKQC